MRKISFENDNYYYVTNSALNGMNVFDDVDDYTRFLFSLAHLNTEKSVGKIGNTRHLLRGSYRGPVAINNDDKLVQIAAFSLIPRSFHLLIKQVKDGGIVRYMQKIGTGYTAYVNKRLGRHGKFFKGSYDAISVNKNMPIDRITQYLHLLPVGQIQPCWQKHGFRDAREIEQYLDEYPWSSYPDYIGKRALSILDKVFEDESLTEAVEYKNFALNWDE